MIGQMTPRLGDEKIKNKMYKNKYAVSNLQLHHAVSLPQHSFLIGLCLSKSDKYYKEPARPHI